MAINVALLGATGSIGKSTLDIIRRHPDKYRLFAISANRSVDSVIDIIREFRPQVVAMHDRRAADTLVERLQENAMAQVEILGNADSIGALPEVDMVVAAIVGAAGLAPTYQAVKGGKKVLLANKEALVMSGKLFMESASKYKALILPVDSEHNAIFQSLEKCAVDGRLHYDTSAVNKLILTASGGPFRQRDLSTFGDIRVEEACQHPNWSMGQKITVDSATMMNKGLELIEACWLFGMPLDKVSAVIHPQSVIHGMVQYNDGSTIAQMGAPDMRTPIANAMAWPERIQSGVMGLDFTQLGHMTFDAIEQERFPCYFLAREAFQQGGGLPTILNAANEIAVEAFLSGMIGFTMIPRLIERCLSEISDGHAFDIESVIDLDSKTRDYGRQILKELQSL
tara:strand:- start:1547 stop:2737 length:1191 start_codon:yes stop_codon:yes gene_type:complete